MNDLLKIAHRGFSRLYPENTLIAFTEALRNGADMIEFDVHMSRDGRLVVIHDETVDRTSNGSGLVKEQSLDELRQYDFSNGFDCGAPVSISTLEEVIDVVGGRAMLNIEIKNCPMQYEGIEAEVVRILKEKDCLGGAIVSSFDHYSLARVRQLHDGIKTGMLYSSLWTSFREEVRYLGVYSLHPHVSVCLPKQLRWAREQGFPVYTWVAGDRMVLHEILKNGAADGIMVNDLRLFG